MVGYDGILWDIMGHAVRYVRICLDNTGLNYHYKTKIIYLYFPNLYFKNDSTLMALFFCLK